MATTLNTRIKLKYDTYANWNSKNPVLLSGELAIAEIPDSTGVAQNEPTFLLKVGNGSSKFNELDWISGKAADVYEWAKAATKPTYAATEITGLDAFIGQQIQDTDTQYQIVKNGDMGFKLQSKAKGAEEWADVNNITLVPPTLTTGETNGTVKYGAQEVAVAGLQDAAFATKASIVAEASAEADKKIQALDAEEVAVGTGEIIEKVSEVDGIVKVSKRALTATDIPTLEIAKTTGLQEALDAKQNNLVFNSPYNGESNKVATMTDVNKAVEGLSGAMHYVGESTSDPSTGTVTIESNSQYTATIGDVVTYQAKEYVCESTGERTVWRLLGDESSYAVKGSIQNTDIAANANIAQSKVAGLEEALASKATPANITSAIESLDVAKTNVTTGNKITGIEEVDGKIAVTTGAITAEDIPSLEMTKIIGLNDEFSNVRQEVTNKIGELKNTDKAVANQFVTAVKQADGKITVERMQPQAADINGLATVATSGKIDDLTQNEGYITFDCGTSSVNI